ncbi:hypothetical protein POSPLADRAFT_1055489 [Postia placenta MAD-698-R-SB12]|uniref:CBM1 domain-containing protein n=1 Tax=Postia placenta MAD-698-R-SB12 TaxID=670580 RepID=A0A1X6N486_9APHY|nr:hypothetical protein POSPLADRAFT_1055489 [Postia placenta MAD-698-R-SB12]OSX63427.1 hypothetical protein POSPLADRAFT_1055489 [Postia placenta MAD-698-R-SB12]
MQFIVKVFAVALAALATQAAATPVEAREPWGPGPKCVSGIPTPTGSNPIYTCL